MTVALSKERRPAPYGANEETWRWAKQRRLRYSDHAHCLHWVAKGRCGVASCQDGHSSRAWMDHVSGWLGDNGERMLLCQPYNFSDVETLAAACDKFGLSAVVYGWGWYGHGTVAIELRPNEDLGGHGTCPVTASGEPNPATPPPNEFGARS